MCCAHWVSARRPVRRMWMAAWVSRSWCEPQLSHLHSLTPSPIRFSLGCFHPQGEHVCVEFLSETSRYVEPALAALKFNKVLNIPSPESSDIPDMFLLRFMKKCPSNSKNQQCTFESGLHEWFMKSCEQTTKGAQHVTFYLKYHNRRNTPITGLCS